MTDSPPTPPAKPHHTSAPMIVLTCAAAMGAIIALAAVVVAVSDAKMRDLPSWIEALATLAAVTAVIAAWLQLRDSRTAARAQAQQATQAALDQARPYVLLSVEIGRDTIFSMDLVLENIGAGPAYDVQIRVDPPLVRANDPEDEKLSGARMFRRPIAMMPPKFELRSWFDSPSQRADHPELPDTHEVTITYHDGRGHDWTETTVLDLTIADDLLFTERYNLHHLAKAVHEIEKHIKSSPLTTGSVEAIVETRGERDARLLDAREARQARFDAFKAREVAGQADVRAAREPDLAAEE